MATSASGSRERAQPRPSSSASPVCTRTSASGIPRCAARSASTSPKPRRTANMDKAMVVKSVCAVAAIAVLGAGCMTAAATSTTPVTSTTPAATLRTTLNALLGEHVILAAAATRAVLDRRDAEFKAAAGALDGNSVDIAKALGSVYGRDAERAFLPLWRRHIGFALDYTVGVATKDQAKQQQAVDNL